ncbi:MAG TPA: DUF1328 domain-containing protein [Methyloceanibacter sp.]|nr:DUF1328 domain-containing protein [Methyloceanibacter sp.]
MGLLKWAIIALVISVLAGAFGFTRLEHGAAKVAKLLFVIFLVLFVAILILSLTIGDWR